MSDKTGGPAFLAITLVTHPLTGEGVPEVLRLDEETTVKEIVKWYRDAHRDPEGNYRVFDLRLTQAR